METRSLFPPPPPYFESFAAEEESPSETKEESKIDQTQLQPPTLVNGEYTVFAELQEVHKYRFLVSLKTYLGNHWNSEIDSRTTISK